MYSWEDGYPDEYFFFWFFLFLCDNIIYCGYSLEVLIRMAQVVHSQDPDQYVYLHWAGPLLIFVITLWAKSAASRLWIFFLFFRENSVWHWMNIVSFLERVRKIFQIVVCWIFRDHAEHDMHRVDPDQLASEEANWSGSALFVIKYVNFYQKSRSSNLIGWKLKVGMAS